MDLAAEVHNFAFYHPSKSVYCTVEIVQKKITNTNHPNYNQFNALVKGQKIGLKYVSDRPREILEVLHNRIVKFAVTSVDIPKTNSRCNQTVKYIFDTVELCDILGEN